MHPWAAESLYVSGNDKHDIRVNPTNKYVILNLSVVYSDLLSDLLAFYVTWIVTYIWPTIGFFYLTFYLKSNLTYVDSDIRLASYVSKNVTCWWTGTVCDISDIHADTNWPIAWPSFQIFPTFYPSRTRARRVAEVSGFKNCAALGSKDKVCL